MKYEIRWYKEKRIHSETRPWVSERIGWELEKIVETTHWWRAELAFFNRAIVCGAPFGFEYAMSTKLRIRIIP